MEVEKAILEIKSLFFGSVSVKLLCCLGLLSISLWSCKPDIDQLFTEAKQFSNNGQYEKAIEVYNKILGRDSLNQLAYFNRGRCYYFLERNKEAVSDYNKVIILQPPSDGQIEFRWNRGSPFAPKEGRYKVYYEEAVFERAVTEYQMDSAKKAFTDFQVCLDIGYEKTVCKRYIGCLYIAYQKKEKGCSLLKEAMMEGDTTSYSLLHKYCY
jgi:tetratricopeptide (TPR) repeat protein